MPDSCSRAFLFMAKRKNSVLWEITRSDSVLRSYLFGTMHVKDDIAFGHNELALAKLHTCNLIACEYNLSEAQGRGMSESFLIPDSKSLKDFVSERRYERMRKIMAKSFDLDLEQLQHLLPMTLMSIVSESILQKNNNVSLDQFIWDQGVDLGLELEGLESFDGQLYIMSQIDLEYQIKMLYSSMKNVKKFKSKILNLVELYKNQDIHKLYKLSKKSLGSYKNLMLFDRNKNMVERIAALSAEYNAFYAVGAAHLSGQKGILHLLKKRGFILKPCK